ncbi:hypothetical protein LJC56_12070 [Christensenellaceae bacterium OttesenSCG-928-K19]|nr:hypothetical protein [Christensenellaceae bacterium OttesenSCG-928-K19]
MRTGINKTILAMVMAIALTVILLSGCGLLPGLEKESEVDTNSSVTGIDANSSVTDEINENSTLPLALLTPHNSVRDELQEDESLDSVNNFMSFDYYADGYMLSFSGFPEDDSEYCLTDMEITSGEYDVLGISILDDMAQAAQVLEGYGYSAKEDDPDAFMKDGVKIELDGESTVETITIDVLTAYTSGNLY